MEENKNRAVVGNNPKRRRDNKRRRLRQNREGVNLTFGKHNDPSVEGKKGYEKTKNKLRSEEIRKKRSDKLSERWKNPKEKENFLKALEKGRRNMNQSENGKKSRLYENEIAKTIVADKIFLPNEVCDRIVVRNGEIFFVEIKRKKSQRLRPKQREFREIAKDRYEVIYG